MKIFWVFQEEMFSTFSDYTYYILKHFIMNYDDSSETS